MLKQDVVFCRSIFEKIKNNFKDQEIWSAEQYYDNLSFISIKTLKSNKKAIESCMKESSGFIKIFRRHLFSDGFEFIEPKNEKLFFNNVALNSLCNLSEGTLDRIIHSEKNGFLTEISESNFKDRFEILGINRFVKPPTESKLVAARRNIEFKKGTTFLFINILKPFFRNTTHLRIYDRYLRNRSRGFLNLTRILDMCEKLSKCEIHTLHYKNNEINKFDIEYLDFEKELKEKYGEDIIEVSSTTPHRRKIITDDFEIKIDPGLDFVNEKYVARDNDVDIQIKMLKA